MELELTKEYVEQLRQAVANQDIIFIATTLDEQHPADISAVLDELNTEESKFIIDLLPKPISAEIISNLDSDIRRRFLKVFKNQEIAALLAYIDSDDAADMLEEQEVKFREEVIALIEDPKIADDIIELLHYDDDCAGGLMAKELIKANINWTITQTIEEIRRQAENVEKIFSVYVVDDYDKLLGIVGVKNILLARASTSISDIYDDEIIAIESYRESWEVVDMMRKYDLEAIPVINMAGKLLGRITIDDVVDVITEQAAEEQQIMAGISSDVEVEDSIWLSAKARLPWLLVGMGGGLTGAQFMGLFESELRIVPAMAFFIPLITATGGNVGIQSSTVIVQSLANSTGLEGGYQNKILRIMLIGLLNALVISSLVFIFACFTGHVNLAFVVASALFSVVLLSSLMGTITPLILDHYGVNPALAAGPFITTANDLMGLAVYFGVARLLLNI